MATARKYFAVLVAAFHGILMSAVRPILNRIDDHIYDVDNVLDSVEKLQEKLDKAAAKALIKGDACVDQANYYNELADEAYEASDRAARTKMRLSKLLD